MGLFFNRLALCRQFSRVLAGGNRELGLRTMHTGRMQLSNLQPRPAVRDLPLAGHEKILLQMLNGDDDQKLQGKHNDAMASGAYQLDLSSWIWEAMIQSVPQGVKLSSRVEALHTVNNHQGLSVHVKRDDCLPYGSRWRALASIADCARRRRCSHVALQVNSSTSLSGINALSHMLLEQGMIPLLMIEQNGNENTNWWDSLDKSFVPVTNDQVYPVALGSEEDTLERMKQVTGATNVACFPGDGECYQATGGMGTLLYDICVDESACSRTFDDVVFSVGMEFGAGVVGAFNEALSQTNHKYATNPKTVRLFCNKEDQQKIVDKIFRCSENVKDFLNLETAPTPNIVAVEGRSPNRRLDPTSNNANTNIVVYNVEDYQNSVSELWLNNGQKSALPVAEDVHKRDHVESRNVLVVM